MPYDKYSKILTKYVLVSDVDKDCWLSMKETPAEITPYPGFHTETWFYRRT